MGGVPFKSTGCNTCRRRKVKCDEAKPECMRCVKNGHVCTGYERTRVFIHKSASVMVDDNRTLTRQSRPNGATSARACILNLVDRDIPRLNINAEVRSQLLNSLIDWYLPTSHLLQGGAGKERKNLLQSLPEVSGSSILLDKAITSLSTVFLAKQNRDGRLLEYSTKLYGNAMETLHGKIRAGSKLGPDVLYTTIVFQLYELINCSPPGFSAWIAHVQGSSAVTSQCAGQNDRNSAEKLFHRQLRYVALCDAIGKRTAPGYFNSPGWRNGGLATSEPIDELMDELTECTALMEQVDAYVEHADPNSLQSIQVGEHLMLSCLSLEEKLHQTCLAMEEKLGCPSVLSPDSSLYKDFGSALLTDLFPEPLQYPSLTCAESHLVYWTTLLLLYPLLDQLMVVLDRPDNDVALPKCQSPKDGIGSPSSGSEVLADFTALAELYADQVCRSVIYCLQPGMKTLGAQNLLAPLSQSTQFFAVEGLPEKRAWCQGVFMSLPRVGLGIAPFVKDLVWPKYQLAQRQKSSSPEKSPSPRTQSSSLGSPSSGVEEHKQLPTRSATSSSEYFEKDGLQ